jgi:hypothetical protein
MRATTMAAASAAMVRGQEVWRGMVTVVLVIGILLVVWVRSRSMAGDAVSIRPAGRGPVAGRSRAGRVRREPGRELTLRRQGLAS